jgi:hypothetical protein
MIIQFLLASAMLLMIMQFLCDTVDADSPQRVVNSSASSPERVVNSLASAPEKNVINSAASHVKFSEEN